MNDTEYISCKFLDGNFDFLQTFLDNLPSGILNTIGSLGIENPPLLFETYVSLPVPSFLYNDYLPVNANRFPFVYELILFYL